MGLFQRVFPQVPILGSLPQTSLSDHKEATCELCISLLISTAPIWGGGIVLLIMQTTGESLGYWTCLRRIIQNGELYMYSASALAPVIYIVTRDRYNVRSFPSKHAFMGIVIVFAILSTIIFTVERLKTQPLPSSMITLSAVLYAFAIVIFYFALVYNNALPPNPAQAIRNQEDIYLKKLRKHRG